MQADPRHSLAGTLLPIGGVMVAVCVVSSADADVRPIARVLWLLPAVAVICRGDGPVVARVAQPR